MNKSEKEHSGKTNLISIRNKVTTLEKLSVPCPSSIYEFVGCSNPINFQCYC